MTAEKLDAVKTPHLVILDGANNLQRDAVQTIVKAHTEVWWHEMPDVWIVDGQTAAYWRDIIMPVLGLSSAGVVVFRLPDSGLRSWAASSLGRPKSKWLHEIYSGWPQPPATPPAAALTPADDDIPF
ncbi:MAG: hypothetical protein ABW167_14660 [Baekduia sp.]